MYSYELQKQRGYGYKTNLGVAKHLALVECIKSDKKWMQKQPKKKLKKNTYLNI